MGWRNGLRVRCRSAIVEVHLRTVLVGCWCEHLLGFLLPRSPIERQFHRFKSPNSSRILYPIPKIQLYLPDTDHPHQKDDENDENNTASDTTSDVEELGLLGATFTSEAAAASAGRLSSGVLQAHSFVIAVAHADIRALCARSIVPWLALALEVACFWYQEAISVRVAVHLSVARFARVGAVRFAGLIETVGKLRHQRAAIIKSKRKYAKSTRQA